MTAIPWRRTLAAALLLAAGTSVWSCGGSARAPADETAGETAGETETTSPASQIETAERVRLEVPPEARELVLAEMRQLLEAVDGTLDGLVAGRMEAVARAAEKGGTAYAVDLDPAVADDLPREFKQLGMRTHRGFDDLAESAAAGADQQEILGKLSELTGTCVACHAAYRLDATRR